VSVGGGVFVWHLRPRRRRCSNEPVQLLDALSHDTRRPSRRKLSELCRRGSEHSARFFASCVQLEAAHVRVGHVMPHLYQTPEIGKGWHWFDNSKGLQIAVPDELLQNLLPLIE
jgi:hypothetical protein